MLGGGFDLTQKIRVYGGKAPATPGSRCPHISRTRVDAGAEDFGVRFISPLLSS
jgi:hypothetical protein